MSNPGNIVGGHKANLNNPQTSDESKQHSKEVLDQEFNGGNVGSASDEGKNPGNIAGGHKANLNNPQTSDEAKQHSKEVLDSMK